VKIFTGSGWLSHEYTTLPLQPGWNRGLRVDLKKAHFASGASGYDPSGYLIRRNEIQAVQFVVYPAQEAEGYVCIDNLRLERQGLLQAGDFALNSTVDITASGEDAAKANLRGLPGGRGIQGGA